MAGADGPDRAGGTPGPDGRPTRGTVGVYDRPASADRRARLVRIGVWAVALVAGVGGWWLAGAPGLGLG